MVASTRYQARDKLVAEIAGLRLGAVIGDIEDWEETLRDAVAEGGMLGIALGGATRDSVSPVSRTVHLERAFEAGDTAIEMLTSGTTGAPKRVPISYRTLTDAVEDAILATAQAGTTDTSAPFIQFYPLGNISGLSA